MRTIYVGTEKKIAVISYDIKKSDLLKETEFNPKLPLENLGAEIFYHLLFQAVGENLFLGKR